MKKFLTLAIAAHAAAALSFAQPEDVTRHVRCMMGTDLDGRIIPMAVVPFGMVQLAPDTYYFANGYHYSHSYLQSFSHTHANGNGGGDLQDICVFPVSGKNFENLGEYPSEVQSLFSHDEEWSEPGYYKVNLKSFGITAELTATERCGFHRYTYPSGRQFFTIDLLKGNTSLATTLPERRDTVVASMLEVLDDYTVRGYRVSSGWAPEVHTYFYARFSKKIDSSVLFDRRRPVKGARLESRDSRILLSFADDGQPLVVKVGISPASLEGAELNFRAEAEGRSFDEVRQAAHDAWNEQLGVFSIGDADSKDKELFYTNLYFALMYPQLYSDVDGGCRSSDCKAHKYGFRYYAGVLGLWDTYRNQNPLISILRPDVTADLLKTFQAHYDNCGELPIWTIAGEEDMCMTGYHAMPVIADAMSKGITGFDPYSLLQAMVASANRDCFGYFDHDFRGARYYTKYHYVPRDKEAHSASKTLEYSYDDWCIAQVARMLGKEDDYKTFMERARWYRNVFDPANGNYPNGRYTDGTFRKDFSVFSPATSYFGSDFCEGNSFQYSFFAPQDPYGLMELLGGRDSFVARLDSLFTTTQENEPLLAVGRIGQYAHGNEPVHHVIYLYNFAGQPWKCQERVSQVMRKEYDTTPGGMCGNDDTGQMAAWFIQSAMGCFTFNHGYDYYVFGSPLFEKLSLRHSKGTLTILAPGTSAENCYVRGVRVNGRKWNRNWISGKDLLGGDVTLEFEMGDTPDTTWGSRAKDCPPGMDGKVPRSWK